MGTTGIWQQFKALIRGAGCCHPKIAMAPVRQSFGMDWLFRLRESL
ncbi:hypothetical protein [Endozoicomonas sp. ONNA2]|nr:hypothetical protein [Endozoicomonas sp. ONNA2]